MTERRWRRLRISIANLLVLAVGFGLGLMCEDYIESYKTHWVNAAPRNKVVVIGAIAKPGTYEFSQPTTVTDAVAIAGGLAAAADTRRVAYIQRPISGGQAVVIIVDLQPLLSGRRPVTPIYLNDGDVVTVPKGGPLQSNE